MESNSGNRQITTGLIGSVVALICCFTPALVVLLGAFGFAAVIGYLDYVLLPGLAFFLGLLVYGWRLRSTRAGQSRTSET